MDDDTALLTYLEEKFKNRFTEEDNEYDLRLTEEDLTPPVLTNWLSNKRSGFQRFGGSNNKRPRYDDRRGSWNDRSDRNDWENRGDHSNNYGGNRDRSAWDRRGNRSNDYGDRRDGSNDYGNRREWNDSRRQNSDYDDRRNYSERDRRYNERR